MKSFLINIFRRNGQLLLAAFVLFFSGYLFNIYFNSSASVSVLRNSIESFLQKREKDFEKLSKDTALVTRLYDRQYSEKDLDALVDKKYGIFLYEIKDSIGSPGVLRFWNDQRSYPEPAILNGSDSAGFVNLSNGQFDFIKKSLTLGDGRSVMAIALIPVRWQYYIATTNLEPEFIDQPSAEERVRIEATPTDFPVKSLFGKTLFWLEVKPGYKAAAYNRVIPLVMLIGVLLVLVLWLSFRYSTSIVISRRFNSVLNQPSRRLSGKVFSTES